MRWIVFGFLVVSIVGFVRGEAHAEGAVALERYSFLEAPPPALLPLPPAPARAESEWARKNWEFVPSIGFAVPACRASGGAPSVCDDVGGGMSIGAAALYRVTPYVALGAEISAIELASDPSTSSDAVASSQSHALFFGPIFRGYFIEHGSVDPWVALGFGGGNVVARHWAGMASYAVTETTTTTSVGAGVDFWVSPWLKLGPAFEERFVFSTNGEVCSGPGCPSTSSGGGGVTRTTRLAMDVTLAFGQAM